MERSSTADTADAAERRRRALWRILNARNITLPELARLIGASTPNKFYNFMNGRTQSLSQQTLEKVAGALQVGLDDLSGATSFSGCARRDNSRCAQIVDESKVVLNAIGAPLLERLRRMVDTLNSIYGDLIGVRPRVMSVERQLDEMRLDIRNVAAQIDSMSAARRRDARRSKCMPANDN